MHKKSKYFFSWDNFIITVLVMIIMLFIPLILSLNIFQPFRHTFEDLEISDIGFSKIRESEFVTADTNIVIINSTKINNSDFLNLLKIVTKYSPKVIGIQKILKKTGNEDYDNELNRIINQNDNIILTNELYNFNKSTSQFDSIKSNSDLFNIPSITGFNNLFIDKDKRYYTLREFYPIVKTKGNYDTIFSVKIANKFSQSKTQKLFNRNNEKEIIFYRANFEKFYFIDGSDFIKGDSHISLKNKIVLIGKAEHLGNSFTLDELYYTPLNSIYTGRTLPDMYGIIAHANIISMIINENYFNCMPFFLILVITFAITYLNMYFYSLIKYWKEELYEILSLFLFVIESLIFLIITYKLYYDYNYKLNLTLALFATALSGVVYELWLYSLKPIAFNIYNKLFIRRSK